MLAVYVAATLIGAVLIVVTLLGGGHGHDVDHDVSAEVDHGVDSGSHEAHGGDALGGWFPFVSLRFWTYFALAFGLVGSILQLTGQGQGPMTLGLAVGAGYLSGVAVMRILRFLRQAAGNTTQGVQDLLGSTGKVLVGVGEGDVGKVRCSVKGDSIDLIALSYDGRPIAAGEDVVVLSMDGTRATVQRRTELFGPDGEPR